MGVVAGVVAGRWVGPEAIASVQVATGGSRDEEVGCRGRGTLAWILKGAFLHLMVDSLADYSDIGKLNAFRFISSKPCIKQTGFSMILKS